MEMTSLNVDFDFFIGALTWGSLKALKYFNEQKDEWEQSEKIDFAGRGFTGQPNPTSNSTNGGQS